MLNISGSLRVCINLRLGLQDNAAFYIKILDFAERT